MNITAFLKKQKAVVVDTMICIYEFQAHAYFSPLTHDVFVAFERGNCRGYLSTITLHEVLVKPKRDGNIPLALHYRTLLTASPFLTMVAVTADVADTAAGIRAKYGVTAPDALIVATALTHNAGLITADQKLRRIAELDVFILPSSSRMTT